MRIALLQLNFIVGDLEGNVRKIADTVKKVHNDQVDLCVATELAVLGYPPRDLVFNPGFIQRAVTALENLALELKDAPPVLVGTALANPNPMGRPLYNSAVLLHRGKVGEQFRKTLLPTYDVFDEDRYFEPAEKPGIAAFNGMNIGVTICEDIWNDKDFWLHQRYTADPVERIMRAGNVNCLVNLSASPFSVGKQQFRENMLSELAKKYNVPVVYVNQIGGNDDLVFDGRSCVVDSQGNIIARAKAFQEDLLIADIETQNRIEQDDFTPASEIWRALVLGTRDYTMKCGFKKVLLGISGGIDSALTAVIAAEAIGKENVLGVLMPSPYSSQGSVNDSLELAKRIGIKTYTVPISKIMEAISISLKEPFSGLAEDVTEENIQSRIRGNLLMALSNKFNSLLLTTGNKSELAVGYCTIYGDMSGGLAVIADVPKTMVYTIADWVNANKGNCIPQQIIIKAPSAELRPNQVDQDSLPPYNVLDEILRRHIELHQGCDEIVQSGFKSETVKKVLRLVRIAEFKRKQAAPGLKVTDRAFGTGWRVPIARKE